MPKTRKQMVGAWGEEQASLFLQAKGYTLVERNFRIRGGEIDIVATHRKPHHGETLCFIEVKTRAAADGSAERATGKEKLRRLFSAARAYCVRHGVNTEQTPIQFEQVTVYDRGDGTGRCILYTIPVT